MEQHKELGLILHQEIKKEFNIKNLRWYFENDSILVANEIVELNKGYYPQSFSINFFTYGSDCDFSIRIFKNYIDESIDEYAFDEITWTFCIIDVNGLEKFFQSFTKVNFVNSSYEVDISNMIKFSMLFEQADELLPEGNLTVRCEVFSSSFPGKSLNNVSLYHLDKIKENGKLWEHYQIDPGETVLESVKHMIIDMCNFLINLDDFRNNRMELQSVDLLKQKLLGRAKPNELMRTYLHSNPVFQTCCRLERKVKKELEICSRCDNIMRDLEPEFQILWNDIKPQLKEELSNLSAKTADLEFLSLLDTFVQKLNQEVYLRIKKNRELILSEISDLNIEFIDFLNCLKMNNYFRFFLHVVENELENDEEYIEYCPELDNENEQALVVKTKDDVIFTLPFQQNKETLGSKLISESPYFKAMKECPRNAVKEPVHLKEYSQVFLQILCFLQEEKITTKQFQMLCDIYETADKYMMEKLTQLCADLMKPLLSKENIDVVETLAEIHVDIYLKDIVNAFKDQNKCNESLVLEDAVPTMNCVMNQCFSSGSQHFDFYG